MLNPSTADEIKNDPTVARCCKRAASLGFGACGITNAYALRSTDPAGLYKVQDPVGPDNDRAIYEALVWARDGTVLCGWGEHAKYRNRGLHVLQMMLDVGVTPYCLLQNASGHPQHPLFLAYDLVPQLLDVKRLLPGRKSI